MKRGFLNSPFFYSPFWSKCRDHLFAYRTFYIILLICGLAGFGFGLGGATVYTHRVTIIELSDGYIMGIMNGTLNGGSLFWSRILSLLGLLALVLFFSLHRYFIPLHFVIVIYRGFLTGFKIMLLIGMYGITGVFSSLLFVLPFETVFFIGLSFIIVCAADRSLCLGGRAYFKAEPEFRKLLIRILPAIIFILIFCILEAIFIPIFVGVL